MPNKIDVSEQFKSLSWGERILYSGANIRHGEGKNVILLMLSLFFLLITAYLLKPVREMLILTQENSEIRSYSVALQVLILMIILPIYGVFSRRYNSLNFMVGIVAFFSLNLVLFYFLGLNDVNFSIVFFVWLGAFGVLIISQFWAFASQIYSREAGERLFALVAIGASIGGWVGSAIAKYLVLHFDANEIILFSVFPLLTSVIFASFINISSNNATSNQSISKENPSLLSGMTLVLKNRYLLMIGLFVVLINWNSSIGDYILAVIVETIYQQGIEQNVISDSKETYIGKFYSNFYFWVNAVGVFVQFFIVSRLIKWAGFHIAFILTPILIFMGYGLLAFFPIVSVFKLVKITENGLGYSLQNTSLQILYLPTTRREQYEGRAFIDTICWKTGDLLQAASVFIGINILFLRPANFIYLNVTLAALMIALAYFIGKHYRNKLSTDS